MLNKKVYNAIMAPSIATEEDFFSFLATLSYVEAFFIHLGVDASTVIGLPSDRYLLIVSKTNETRGYMIAIPQGNKAIYKRSLGGSGWTVWTTMLAPQTGGGNKCSLFPDKGGGINVCDEGISWTDQRIGMPHKAGFFESDDDIEQLPGAYFQYGCCLRSHYGIAVRAVFSNSTKSEQCGRSHSCDTVRYAVCNIQIRHSKWRMERMDRDLGARHDVVLKEVVA